MPASGGKLQGVLESSDDIGELSAVVIVEIQSGDVKVVELVEMLGPWLTNVDKDKRRQGTKLLAGVLRLMPTGFLSDTECQLLTAFFCDRLKDHYTITPSTLTGLAALTCMDNLPDSAPMEILLALQQNVTCQAITVSHRHSFYSILHNIYTKKKKKVLSDFPSDFLFALISGMDSESDPRNLLYLFSFLPSILSEIPLKHLAEDAFTVLECYFPVDYNPVEEKDDIKREDLARSLEACFASTPEFGEYCLPMICEKLDSSLKIAQMDSLNLLISGIGTWSVEVVSRHIDTLWPALKNVLVPGSEPEVSLLAVRALTSVLAAFSSAVLGDKETKAFTYLLDSISSSTYGFLSDPSLSLFTPTLKLLSAIASVSTITADFVIPSVLPQLIALLESSATGANKDTVLKCLKPFLDASIKHDSWQTDGCREHLSRSLPVIISLLEDPSCRGSAFDCLSAVVSVIPDHYRKKLYEFVNKTVPVESSKCNRDAYAKFISLISENYPDEVENQLLSTFTIPDDYDVDRCRKLLDVLTWVANASPLTLAASRLLLDYITSDKYTRWKAQAVFVLQDYTSSCGVGVLKLLGNECNFPLSLMRSYLGDAQSCADGELAAAANIISNIVRTLEPREQKNILFSGLELLRPKITGAACRSTELVLLEGLVTGLRREVQLDDSLELCTILFTFSITLDSEEARTSAARIVALIINKSNKDEEIDRLLNIGLGVMSKTERCPASVRLCAWITKALVLRGHRSAGQWLAELLQFTSDQSLGMEGAEGIRLVLEHNTLLSADNYCIIGLLYKQRVFESIDLLIPDDNRPSKSASLALAYILKNSPPSLVIGRFEKLIGVMVYCIEEGDPVVSTAILQILSVLLKSAVTHIGALAQTFIPRCLNLAKNSPHMVVRREALECIYLYANFKPEDIMPYKKMVVMELTKCLDDKKRLVRQSAVRARTKWFVI